MAFFIFPGQEKVDRSDVTRGGFLADALKRNTPKRFFRNLRSFLIAIFCSRVSRAIKSLFARPFLVRPFGLPLRPGRNCIPVGGLRYPIAYASVVAGLFRDRGELGSARVFLRRLCET